MTDTSLIRALLQEDHHPDQHDPDLVPPPRPRLRRRRRDLQLHLSRHGRLVAACSALPAAWTITMIAIALAVRYG